MFKRRQATESITLIEALDRLEETERYMKVVMARVAPLLQVQHPIRVLDVGAAQGRNLVGLQRLGFEAYGIEPWAAARETARSLADKLGVAVNIFCGCAEEIPFDDEFFDVVIASSVMEHVTDLEKSLAEIYRVLRPGGIFWFSSASSRCPIQGEISGFPLFGWYPDLVKRRIMYWARRHWPALIGFTGTPALHWWTPRKARYKLREAGFTDVWERWDLRQQGEGGEVGNLCLALIRRNKFIRLFVDVLVPGCSFAARKAANGSNPK